MKLVKAVLLAGLCSSSAFASVLESNYETLVVPAKGLSLDVADGTEIQHSVLRVDRLILEGPLFLNGQSLTIDVKEIIFKDNGRIAGFEQPTLSGADGTKGGVGSNAQHRNGTNGAAGGNAGHGGQAEPGASGLQRPGRVSIFAADIQGDLRIELEGQSGGQGGKGGDGGRGGSGKSGQNGDVWKGRSGGNGGHGGKGGDGGQGADGGNGGAPAVLDVVLGSEIQNLKAIYSRGGKAGLGGAAGKAGDPGAGGSGGSGDSIRIGWDVVKVGGGSSGGSLGPGASGKPGVDGADQHELRADKTYSVEGLLTQKKQVTKMWAQFQVLRELYALAVSASRFVSDKNTQQDFLFDLEKDIETSEKKRILDVLQDLFLSAEAVESASDSDLSLKVQPLIQALHNDIQKNQHTSQIAIQESMIAELESAVLGCQSYSRQKNQLEQKIKLTEITDYFDFPACLHKVKLGKIEDLFFDIIISDRENTVPALWGRAANRMPSGFGYFSSLLRLLDKDIVTFEKEHSQSLKQLLAPRGTANFIQWEQRLRELRDEVYYAR